MQMVVSAGDAADWQHLPAPHGHMTIVRWMDEAPQM